MRPSVRIYCGNRGSSSIFIRNWRTNVRRHSIRLASSSRDKMSRFHEDSGEAERVFRRESERHSGMNPNTIGA